jgi:hypothetical protein
LLKNQISRLTGFSIAIGATFALLATGTAAATPQTAQQKQEEVQAYCLFGEYAPPGYDYAGLRYYTCGDCIGEALRWEADGAFKAVCVAWWEDDWWLHVKCIACKKDDTAVTVPKSA